MEWHLGLRAYDEGLRNRISRRLFFRRKESETRSPEKSLMMSRLSRAACRPRAAAYGAVLQVDLVDDDVFRVAGFTRLCRAEEGEQRAVGPQDARELPGKRLRGTAIEVIDHVPAQDPVHCAVLLGKALLEERGQLIDLAASHVTIEIRVDVLDKDLASRAVRRKN
jgi:hypothetical protein